MKVSKYKYRNYWIQTEKSANGYKATIWIVGSPEWKTVVAEDVFSNGQAQARTERYIDKVLSVGGILR